MKASQNLSGIAASAESTSHSSLLKKAALFVLGGVLAGNTAGLAQQAQNSNATATKTTTTQSTTAPSPTLLAKNEQPVVSSSETPVATTPAPTPSPLVCKPAPVIMRVCKTQEAWDKIKAAKTWTIKGGAIEGPVSSNDTHHR